MRIACEVAVLKKSYLPHNTYAFIVAFPIMDRSFTEELAREICAYRQYLVFGIAISVVFILLSIVSLAVVSPTSGAYYIAGINIVTLLFVIALCGSGLAFCNRRATRLD